MNPILLAVIALVGSNTLFVILRTRACRHHHTHSPDSPPPGTRVSDTQGSVRQVGTPVNAAHPACAPRELDPGAIAAYLAKTPAEREQYELERKW